MIMERVVMKNPVLPINKNRVVEAYTKEEFLKIAETDESARNTYLYKMFMGYAPYKIFGIYGIYKDGDDWVQVYEEEIY